MTKIKWGGAEEPTINNFCTTDNNNILNVILKVLIDRSQPQHSILTEVDKKYSLAR